MRRGRNLVEEYKEVGLAEDRYLLRIPATWEGIQAAKQLEAAGVATHLVLVYRCVPGPSGPAACNSAGCQLSYVLDMNRSTGRELLWQL